MVYVELVLQFYPRPSEGLCVFKVINFVYFYTKARISTGKSKENGASLQEFAFIQTNIYSLSWVTL